MDLHREYSSLNQGQKEAVKKVLCAQDYTLLLGLPGTGKTSTLSLIVRALIARGQRVMICSYTHSAVDNLLAKMAESGLTPAVAVRIGYEASVSTALRGYVSLSALFLSLCICRVEECYFLWSHDLYDQYKAPISESTPILCLPHCILSRSPPRFLLDTQRVGSVSALQQVAEGARIVVCTALTAARHSLLNIKFDWCIVDEAGQINQPTILGPLMKAKRYGLARTSKSNCSAIAHTVLPLYRACILFLRYYCRQLSCPSLPLNNPSMSPPISFPPHVSHPSTPPPTRSPHPIPTQLRACGGRLPTPAHHHQR